MTAGAAISRLRRDRWLLPSTCEMDGDEGCGRPRRRWTSAPASWPPPPPLVNASRRYTTPVSPMENGWGRALPPGSFDPAATIEKKDPLPQRRHGSLYRLIRVTCFLSSPTRRRLWMVEKNPRASSAERAKRSDKHGQDKHPSHPSLYCGPEQGSLPAHVREKLGGNRMCKHAHISHFIMGSTLSCCHGERTPDVPLLLKCSRPGLAAAWVQRYVTKCQHVLYTCVGAKYFGRRVHHGRWVFYINREH